MGNSGSGSTNPNIDESIQQQLKQQQQQHQQQQQQQQSPPIKVLPDLQPNGNAVQLLRSTNNGIILQYGGTISGRKHSQINNSMKNKQRHAAAAITKQPKSSPSIQTGKSKFIYHPNPNPNQQQQNPNPNPNPNSNPIPNYLVMQKRSQTELNLWTTNRGNLRGWKNRQNAAPQQQQQQPPPSPFYRLIPNVDAADGDAEGDAGKLPNGNWNTNNNKNAGKIDLNNEDGRRTSKGAAIDDGGTTGSGMSSGMAGFFNGKKKKSKAPPIPLPSLDKKETIETPPPSSKSAAFTKSSNHPIKKTGTSGFLQSIYQQNNKQPAIRGGIGPITGGGVGVGGGGGVAIPATTAVTSTTALNKRLRLFKLKAAGNQSTPINNTQNQKSYSLNRHEIKSMTAAIHSSRDSSTFAVNRQFIDSKSPPPLLASGIGVGGVGAGGVGMGGALINRLEVTEIEPPPPPRIYRREKSFDLSLLLMNKSNQMNHDDDDDVDVDNVNDYNKDGDDDDDDDDLGRLEMGKNQLKVIDDKPSELTTGNQDPLMPQSKVDDGKNKSIKKDYPDQMNLQKMPLPKMISLKNVVEPKKTQIDNDDHDHDHDADDDDDRHRQQQQQQQQQREILPNNSSSFYFGMNKQELDDERNNQENGQLKSTSSTVSTSSSSSTSSLTSTSASTSMKFLQYQINMGKLTNKMHNRPTITSHNNNVDILNNDRMATLAAIDNDIHNVDVDLDVDADADDDKNGIQLNLRPTLPRRQFEIPRFSPAAAWKTLQQQQQQQQQQQHQQQSSDSGEYSTVNGPDDSGGSPELSYNKIGVDIVHDDRHHHHHLLNTNQQNIIYTSYGGGDGDDPDIDVQLLKRSNEVDNQRNRSKSLEKSMGTPERIDNNLPLIEERIQRIYRDPIHLAIGNFLDNKSGDSGISADDHHHHHHPACVILTDDNNRRPSNTSTHENTIPEHELVDDQHRHQQHHHERLEILKKQQEQQEQLKITNANVDADADDEKHSWTPQLDLIDHDVDRISDELQQQQFLPIDQNRIDRKNYGQIFSLSLPREYHLSPTSHQHRAYRNQQMKLLERQQQQQQQQLNQPFNSLQKLKRTVSNAFSNDNNTNMSIINQQITLKSTTLNLTPGTSTLTSMPTTMPPSSPSNVTANGIHRHMSNWLLESRSAPNSIDNYCPISMSTMPRTSAAAMPSTSTTTKPHVKSISLTTSTTTSITSTTPTSPPSMSRIHSTTKMDDQSINNSDNRRQSTTSIINQQFGSNITNNKNNGKHFMYLPISELQTITTTTTGNKSLNVDHNNNDGDVDKMKTPSTIEKRRENLQDTSPPPSPIPPIFFELNTKNDSIDQALQKSTTSTLKSSTSLLSSSSAPSPTSSSTLNNQNRDNQPRDNQPARHRFTFQSTVRQIERRRLAEKLSRAAERNEAIRVSELEAISRVEEEFQRKREREKAAIRQQLRIYSMNSSEVKKSPALATRSSFASSSSSTSSSVSSS